jgi:hypothetical protein
LLIVLITVLSYNKLKITLSTLAPEQIGDFLLVISILLVTVSFANFAFTYEKSSFDNFKTRLLSHTATFIFILLTALLLASMTISIGVIYPALFGIIAVFSILLYLGVALYDYWDLLRNAEINK